MTAEQLISEMMIGVGAAGIAITLGIFYSQPSIRALLSGDFWMSYAFAVSFALVGLAFASMRVPWLFLPVKYLLACWLMVKLVFVVKRMLAFAKVQEMRVKLEEQLERAERLGDK